MSCRLTSYDVRRRAGARSLIPLIALIGVLTAVAAPKPAPAVTITFEAFPGPDGQLGTSDDVPIVAPALFDDQSQQITTQFASLGIRFLPDPPQHNHSEILNDSSFKRFAGSRPNLLSTSRVIYPFGPLEAEFAVPVRSVRMAIGLGSIDSARPNRLEIFDAGGTLLGSVQASDAFVTLDAPVDIARFRVTATLASNQAAIDNITFTPIPEPSAAMTVVALALGMALSRRGRRRWMTAEPVLVRARE
jgi:hypothetical protein